MNATNFLTRVAANPDDLKELRSLAADLAHESERQPVEVLAEVRRGLARLQPTTEGARTYVLALRDLLSGIENARSERAVAEERRHIAEVKRSWHPILAALLEQPLRPSDIAEQLGVDKAQVSRELKARRAADVVEVYAALGEDARSRHHRLTTDGRFIAEKLVERSQGAERAARAVISFVTQVFMLLVANRRLAAFDANARAAAMLSGTRLDPRRTCDIVELEAKRNGLLSEREGVWYPVLDANKPKRQLKKRLSDAARDRTLPAVLEKVLAKAPTGVPIVVRSSPSLDGAWRSCAGALSVAHAARIIVVTDAEMALGDAVGTPGSLLFYDSLRQLHADMQSRASAVARIADPAAYKACFMDAPEDLLPAEYEPVRFVA